MRLEEVIDIQIGYQLREKRRTAKDNKSGSHQLIQIKDIDDEGRLNADNFIKINPTGNTNRYIVSQGDVLFLSRGQKNVAIIVEKPLKNTLASYYFYILRANPKRVQPAYLAWFINQPTAQAYFESASQGSLMKMVSKTAFVNLNIQLPSLATQQAIAKLDALQKLEAKTMELLVSSRRKLINSLSLRAATSEKQI